MENIVQTVEAAITSAESHVAQEAHTIATDVETEASKAFAEIHNLLARAEDEVKTMTAEVRAAFTSDLSAVIAKAKNLKPTLTQEQIEAQEDAKVLRGIASRAWHRFVAWI